MAQTTIDGLRGLDPGEVFVKSSSHRATDAVQRRLGYRPQTYYSFDRRKAAATSYFVLTQDEFDQVVGINGVSKARFRSGDNWQPSIRGGFSENPAGVGLTTAGKITVGVLAAVGVGGIVMGLRHTLAARPSGNGDGPGTARPYAGRAEQL